MSEAVFDTQANFVKSEVGGQDTLSEHESLDDNDVERNADFYSFIYSYIFNHEVVDFSLVRINFSILILNFNK